MAVDDLRFPSLANPYVELPTSDLEGGVGSMPGSPAMPITENNLIAGRGSIPGVSGEEQLGHLYSKKYKDYEGYFPNAYESTFIFHSPRLEFLNSAVQWVAEKVVEKSVRDKGAVMLSLDMWASEDSWGIIPTYRWSIVFKFYIPSARLGETSLIAPAVVSAIISAITLLLVGIIIWLVAKEVKQIIHGYPPEDYPPGEAPKSIWSYIPWAVAGIGIIALAPMLKGKAPTKKKKKKK